MFVDVVMVIDDTQMDTAFDGIALDTEAATGVRATVFVVGLPRRCRFDDQKCQLTPKNEVVRVALAQLQRDLKRQLRYEQRVGRVKQVDEDIDDQEVGKVVQSVHIVIFLGVGSTLTQMWDNVGYLSHIVGCC